MLDMSPHYYDMNIQFSWETLDQPVIRLWPVVRWSQMLCQGGPDQIWQMLEHWSQGCHDVCRVPSRVQTSLSLSVRWSAAKIVKQPFNGDISPNINVFNWKLDKDQSHLLEGVYDFVSNNCHENINQHSEILQVIGWWAMTAPQHQWRVGGGEKKY